MKSIVNFINESKSAERFIKFNTAEITYLYNVLMNDGGSLDDDVFDELQDYITDRFYSDKEFNLEDELWVEYKDKTKPAGRSDKYNDVKSREQYKYQFTDDELQIFVDFINKDLKYNGKDPDRKKIGEQTLHIIEMNRALGNGLYSQKVKRAVYEHPDYIVGLSTGLDYKRGSKSTYPQIKSFNDLKRTIEWGANTEVNINDKDKKIEVHVYSVADME